MASARPGIALRELRKTRGWTLADVRDRTGIPTSTLSRIENDQMSPTYDLLLRLSNGLSLDLTQLLSTTPEVPPNGADQVGRRSVNWSEDGERVQMTNHTLRYLSTDLLHKQVTPILCEYRARTLEEFGDFMRHEGEEFLFVLDGDLELHTDCYAPLKLKAGESVYFDSRMGHAYLAGGKEPCHALSICTVPQYPASDRKEIGSLPKLEVTHLPQKDGERVAARRVKRKPRRRSVSA
jgi:transcriptional regulator with XRE-family HTH domain